MASTLSVLGPKAQTMAEARSNLERCETVVLKVRFDGMWLTHTGRPAPVDRPPRQASSGSTSFMPRMSQMANSDASPMS